MPFRFSDERYWTMTEVVYRHYRENIPHTLLAEQYKVPRATIVRWINRYHVDISKQGLLAKRRDSSTIAKLDCPHNSCFVCGNPVPEVRKNSSFCSKKCKRYYYLLNHCSDEQCPGYAELMHLHWKIRFNPQRLDR